jgi:hypothetical protein
MGRHKSNATQLAAQANPDGCEKLDLVAVRIAAYTNTIRGARERRAQHAFPLLGSLAKKWELSDAFSMCGRIRPLSAIWPLKSEVGI